MATTYSVFSGSFADELGQRFLKIMNTAGDNAFHDLYEHSMPQQPKQYRQCLDRVAAWDPSVINDEVLRINRDFPDAEECFRHVYVSYVKSMRGGKTVRLMVSVPKMSEFVHAFLQNFSRHRCIRDARYFQQSSLLEQRMVCMDALRDSLFQFLDEDHVKLEGTSVVSESISRAARDTPKHPASVVARDDNASDASFRGSHEASARSSARDDEVHSSQHEPNDAAVDDRRDRREGSVVSVHSGASEESQSRRRPPSETGSAASSRHSNTQRCEEGSRVVSHVFEPLMSAVPEDDLAHEPYDDDETNIGPDDSVSNADFATKQHQQIAKYISRQNTIAEDEDAESRAQSDRSSRSSLSLSSVSISQGGIVPRRSADGGGGGLVRESFREMTGSGGYEHIEEERLSETSMREASTKRGKRNKSPVRSYVTSLTDD